MEAGFERTMHDANIDAASVSLGDVVLEREANRLSVQIISQIPLSMEQTAAAERGLSKLLPGIHLAATWKLPEPVLPPTPSGDKPSAASASTPAPNHSAPDAGPRVLFGRSIKSNKRDAIASLTESEAIVVVCGEILSFELVEPWGKADPTRQQTFRVNINITDHQDSVTCSLNFFDDAKRQRFGEALEEVQKAHDGLLVRGVCKFSKFAREIQLFTNDVNVVSLPQRQDASEEKRVELHMHSRMSSMDGLTDVTEAFKTAKRFGHKALAITDHGVVQAYPEAAKASKKTGVKAIFGVEGYLLPDAELIPLDNSYVVFDIETTGLKPEHAEIIEIGAVKIVDGTITDRFSTFINDGVIIPPNITELTRITNDMLLGAPPLREALQAFQKFADGSVLVAHNANFDVGFMRFHGKRFGLNFAEPYADTLMLARYLLHDLPNHKLDTVCNYFEIDISGHHRAVDDAEATSQVFLRLLDDLKTRNVQTLPVHLSHPDEEDTKEKRKNSQKTNHIILLATTQDSLKNLYRLVSYAHLDHFRSRPRIPRSLLSIFRTGILLGSACEQGELYQAIVRGEDEQTVEKIASAYDFLEIQPLCNNAFMIREGIVPDEDALRDINRRIVALGENLHKPVAATGDVHFLEPTDAEFRKVLLMKQGFKDAEFQPPLYFKTTAEMLEEFSYLGEQTAHAVVIDAPNAIADLCAPLKPFPDGTHAPEIPNAANELRDMTLNTAHDIYGDPLPDIVQARLDKELHSIIGNGYASLYLMAQRLVHKSLSDGYLVGSRGSVGSSLVATMAGITEVNALQPHYVCPKCKHSDFDIDHELYACGVDMPDKNCPVCGAKYKKDGFGIPFEVFLGFKGDKTPDIDLNFSGEYQPVAHKYVEEMFGVGHAFRAGTISGLAERKAYECVDAYVEQTGRQIRKAERERLCLGCMNVKVTTGQHPGGIVIVPKTDDILDYTPIQYPADKKDKNTITTHFDFHAMDDRLVKLDILGHDDPTALRMLEDLTGLNPRKIPLDDEETMQIFSTSKPLGIDLSGLDCKIGTFGVPEFGTGFVRTVLENTLPTSMEELIRIAGLTHGTDVWLNNAEPLVLNKIAKLSEVLCTRDDIMNYLIAHGMEPSISFKIMESVRKGRGLTPEMETAMNEGKIPAWFLDSCKKIKYMFPRGHAVAYAMMSFRIAYYKVHYPEAFYAVYYTVRADAFDITQSLGGADTVLETIKRVEKAAQFKDFAERKKDKELQTILEVIYEMNLRGIELLPIDIYRSQATKFVVENGAIRPPFNALPGVGNTAAISLVENRGTAPFLSVEDFRKRTGVNSAFVEKLDQCGCFKGLPSENQISLF